MSSNTNVQQDLIDLSERKWGWMSLKDADSLAGLFHDEAVFVHMGATMKREQELDVIRTGAIHYRDIEIRETSVRFPGGGTAIVLSRIQLTAVVGGNEVSNPFVVTEVYVQQGEGWILASMSFTRLLTP